MIPLYGLLEGDTLVLLIFAYPEDSIERLGQKIQDAAAVRVAPLESFKVVWKDRELDLRSNVESSGLCALDLVKVVGETTHGV